MEDEREILSRFNKLPTSNQVTALFVGAKDIGKHRVANAITKCNLDFKPQIRTAKSLPLPPDPENKRPRIDFVVFFIDMSNKTSLDIVKNSLKYVDVEYFLGHCCFVVTNVKNEPIHAIGIQDVVGLSDMYDSPLICSELQTKQGQNCLARKLVHYLQIASGHCSDLTPMLVDVTKRSFLQEEET
ncbi:centromere protein M-like [Actinia tenebrosa]|uniref:Centromere protein M n=1 Tax=Actinia tenebrosa TaxID=6105 RepID=A0A6P8J696_ACTTE|nr:centromere protein M-like [Actinia tenebrosa]